MLICALVCAPVFSENGVRIHFLERDRASIYYQQHYLAIFAHDNTIWVTFQMVSKLLSGAETSGAYVHPVSGRTFRIGAFDAYCVR